MKEITFKDIQEANKTIKTTDVKGKDYAEVNQRIKHLEWYIHKEQLRLRW